MLPHDPTAAEHQHKNIDTEHELYCYTSPTFQERIIV